MQQSNFIVPELVSFEEAITLTQSLLSEMSTASLPGKAIERAISELVKTANGARGFFVTYLTSDTAVADNPSAEVMQALRSNPEMVADLLVKNLAMSTAMAMTHRRNQNEEMAQQSERVRSRTAKLIELVELPAVRELSSKLLETIATGSGSYQDFLERWGYDTTQREAISEALKRSIH